MLITHLYTSSQWSCSPSVLFPQSVDCERVRYVYKASTATRDGPLWTFIKFHGQRIGDVVFYAVDAWVKKREPALYHYEQLVYPTAVEVCNTLYHDLRKIAYFFSLLAVARQCIYHSTIGLSSLGLNSHLLNLWLK